jgi:hypothetical protein
VPPSYRLALSPVGQQQDIDTIALRYSEEWWLQQLAARNLSAIWLRSKYPHNYEITAVEAYMDLYQLTGDPKYLAAVDGFYEMFREHWMHIGGTVAIKEWKLYPPGSYFLDTWVSVLFPLRPHAITTRYLFLLPTLWQGNTAHFNGNCTLDPNHLPDPPCPLPLKPLGNSGADPEGTGTIICKGGTVNIDFALLLAFAIAASDVV